MNSWNRCCSTITTTETTLSSKFEDGGITEDFGLPKSLLSIENHFELSKTWDHRIFWDHPGPYFQLNLLLDHQRLLDLQIIWNHQWPYFHLKIDSSSGPPNQPELPHPPEVSQRYQENILGTSRLILRSPDGDKKKKTVHTLANIGDVGVAALLWRRLPVPRLSGITNYDDFTR